MQRVAYLDIAAGIMTIWVMVFHALYPMYGTNELQIVPWLYYFMPWFFYKAGMMFHPKTFSDEYHSGIKKLIKTFIIWSFIGWLSHLGWHWFVGDLTLRIAFYSPLRSLLLKAQVPLNGALWFLPILFVVRIIGNWLIRKGMRTIWIILSSLACILLCKIVHWQFMPVWISGTAWGLFFFSFGYLLQRKETKMWVAIVAAIIFVGSLFTDIPSVYCKSGTSLIQILWYPACVAGCITFNNFCRILDKVETQIASKIGVRFLLLFKHVGINAMNYYAPHKIIFHLGFNIIVLYKIEWYDKWQGLLIVLVAYAIILPMVNVIVNKIKVRHS